MRCKSCGAKFSDRACCAGSYQDLIDLGNRAKDMEAALKALLADPHGCSMCHSGKLINALKDHQPDCGYLLADQALWGGQS